ncbi:MAG: EAL domain-containing protein [Lachnospiraceae bacterium]|jgi:EAL domain-containing protein (putative c-di-GMP-specific phosphodiesterase class I)|nr:EAL domain-containing protein [Lachnospiraceae bacterium]MCH4029474.1 EAL domain-containing protein [Lachnospiraceae bacterium]MCH4067675.1 EAL domain-containing protein [Lachnospiraceae bacterium]MCH4113698.1 EAL domain-containing protein [Lachnospiraceae bacterium]MCI1354069.1 EAL domain-containing protein [Lachnospiraceae bacterium]
MNTSEMEDYIVSHLDEALEKGWIAAYYQPLARTITNAPAGAEALARWLDPEYGNIMPGTFIPVLEKAGLIYKVDSFMLTEAVKLQRRRIDAGLKISPISVNLSRQDFDRLDVLSFVKEQLSRYKISQDLIVLELTESLLVQNKDKMTTVVKDLRSAGFRVWMDDFGSGYSSLIFLNDYTLDLIKLDMGFLKSFTATSREIMRSTVNMAKRLGIRTLAEGVETEEQVRFLREIGCDMMQGYYYSKPFPPESMEAYLRSADTPAETIEWKDFYDRADTFMINSDAPCAVLEYDISQDHIRYLFLDEKEKDELRGLGRTNRQESEFILNNKHIPLHAKFFEFYKKIINTGEDATIYFSDNSFFIRMSGSMVVRQEDRCIFSLSIVNVTEDRMQTPGKVLVKTATDIVLLFDDVHILNPENDTADNLINNFGINAGLTDQDDLRRGLRYFCNYMIYPDDRERYWKFADPDTMIRRIQQSSDGILRDSFRVMLPNRKNLKYVWREFNLLLVPGSNDKKVLSAIKDSLATDDLNIIIRELAKEQKII